MGSKYLIQCIIAVMLFICSSSSGQESNYDWLGTPVYYTNSQHLPGMALGQPAYTVPYTPAYYASGAYYAPGIYGLFPYGTGYSTTGFLTGFGMTGRVTDPSGRGIAGARVILRNIYDVGTFSTTTDYMGSYGINAPDGLYQVTASLPGYTFSQSVGRVMTGFAAPVLNIVGYPASQAGAAQSSQAAYTQTGGAYGTQITLPSAAYGTSAQASSTAIPSSTGYYEGDGRY